MKGNFSTHGHLTRQKELDTECADGELTAETLARMKVASFPETPVVDAAKSQCGPS